jgi:hypothetical protein
MSGCSGVNRREFIKAASAGAALLAAGYRLKEPVAGVEALRSQTGDIRMRVLEHAVFAPSSHNTQPWLVELTAKGMKLFVDRSRLLPAADPKARQAHISQGTFLEMLEIAARQFGYRADLTYFPAGEYAADAVEDRPVAAIALRPDSAIVPDPLFAAIPTRQTNRRPYQRTRPPSVVELAAIRSALRSDAIDWRITGKEAQRQAVAGICGEAMAIEVSNEARNREMAKWFRFSDHELREKRDGFGMAQGGTEGMKRWIAETFVLTHALAASPAGAFAQGAIAQAREQTASTPLFAALATVGNSRLDQLLAGRAYARVHLAATSQGLAMQPMSQAEEEYAEMDDLRRRLKQALQVTNGQTVQMLFRLGHARPTTSAPRREPAALIRRQEAVF